MDDIFFTALKAILGIGFLLACLVGAFVCFIRAGRGRKIRNDMEDK